MIIAPRNKWKKDVIDELSKVVMERLEVLRCVYVAKKQKLPPLSTGDVVKYRTAH